MPLSGKGGGLSFDKLAHFLLFFFVTINTVFYFSKDNKQLFLVMLFIATLPFVTEIGQIYIKGRNFDYMDILADYLGLAFGVLLFFLVKKQCIQFFKFLGEEYIPNQKS